ncbi:SDR family NAD(P)-dependent oxidoreductase [Ferrovibrio xuzhouensis]|uniref:SDR family NAD(P)-dependent oxidoreductase n=1 Tax=Ferrovibrio xuzhouensis TaxID=1576914 RepID=A0ABV7VHS7_9PROT
MTSQTNKGTALITGASSGIGAVYADRLAGQGYDLILVARDQAGLEAKAKALAGTGRAVRTVAADLTKAAEIARVATILRDDEAITLLLNNAGIGATAPLLASDIDALEAMIALNVTALTRLTHAVAPAFARRGQGTIINVSSVTALAPELFNGVYAASKAYVLTMTQALHHELAEKGVRVQAVLPGVTSTTFWATAGLPVANLPAGIVMTPDQLVDAALAGLAQGELVTIPSLPDAGDWAALETARKALAPNLSKSAPAARYTETATRAA